MANPISVTPEQITEMNEKNTALQSKKSFNKKKVNNYSKDECKSEISRMDNSKQNTSAYYAHVKDRARRIPWVA